MGNGIHVEVRKRGFRLVRGKAVMAKDVPPRYSRYVGMYSHHWRVHLLAIS